MKASDLDLESVKPINIDTAGLEPGSTATTFSTFLSAVVSGDMATAESLISDDVEWGLMPYLKVLRGKGEVMPWLKAGYSSRKEPITISNVAADGWGVYEYWNIGIVTDELIAFGNQQDWPWPGDPQKFLGRRYRVAQCFVYHLDASGKIDLMRQYLDVGSVWAQLK